MIRIMVIVGALLLAGCEVETVQEAEAVMTFNGCRTEANDEIAAKVSDLELRTLEMTVACAKEEESCTEEAIAELRRDLQVVKGERELWNARCDNLR